MKLSFLLTRLRHWCRTIPKDPSEILAARISSARILEELNDLRALSDSVQARIARLETSPPSAPAAMGDGADDTLRGQAQLEAAIENLRTRTDAVLARIAAVEAERVRPIAASAAPQTQNAYDHLMGLHNNLLNQTNALLRNLQEERRTDGLRDSKGPVIDVRTPPFPAAISAIDGVLPCRIIDVGAQNLTSEGHVYAPMQAAGACRIIGFEPLQEASGHRPDGEDGVRMLPYAIGDGSRGVLHITRFDPASSLLEPDAAFLEQFMALPIMCEPVRTIEIDTVRMDDVQEIDDVDFIKIDVQGGELDVLKGSVRLLESAVVVHTEVEFAPLYRGQPLFADLDSFLRGQGFELMDLTKFGYAGYKELPSRASVSRLAWADAVYFKSQVPKVQSPLVKLLKAAYIAHVNYGLFDLAANLLAHYDRAAGQTLAPAYVATISPDAQRAPAP